MTSEWTITVCPEHGMVDENECRLENDLRFTHRPSVIGSCDRPCERVTVVPKAAEAHAKQMRAALVRCSNLLSHINGAQPVLADVREALAVLSVTEGTGNGG